jgi:uncharacterized protein YigE (DUF2233 family)
MTQTIKYYLVHLAHNVFTDASPLLVCKDDLDPHFETTTTIIANSSGDYSPEYIGNYVANARLHGIVDPANACNQFAHDKFNAVFLVRDDHCKSLTPINVLPINAEIYFSLIDAVDTVTIY